MDKLCIGNNTYIDSSCKLSGNIVIGNNCIIGPFNVLKNVHKEIPKMLGVTKLITKRGKENFATAWYAAGKKNAGLLSKLIIGVHVVAASGEYYYAIPQIDWDMISTNQKDLWDAGKYDEAILTEMGLKWEGDKIVKA